MPASIPESAAPVAAAPADITRTPSSGRIPKAIARRVEPSFARVAKPRRTKSTYADTVAVTAQPGSPRCR
jgi:hypothetical protein